MIDRQEISELAREFGLETNVVEKDYVLGWILAGISHESALKSDWVFKGGTCLKKCYFETYRFSEDLDFTLRNPQHINEAFLLDAFGRVRDWVYEQSGVEIPRDTIRFEVYSNPRGRLSVEGRVGYIGPLQRRGSIPRIKLDLTDDERLVFDPVMRSVHHPYSDKPAEGIQAQCYRYEELFAEKVRALAERMRPRDLYDVIHLYRHDEMVADRVLVMKALREKCAYKGIPEPTAELLQGKPEQTELVAEWANMLAHQLPQLPSITQFLEELPKVFGWLVATTSKAVFSPAPVGSNVDRGWQPPAMVQAWRTTVPVEIFRFAAVNHLCIDLRYGGNNRLIEPYSLWRSQAGDLLLQAVKHENGEDRSYRVDRIEGATATNVPFVPRYAIQMSASGPVTVMPSTPRSSTSTRSFQSSSRTSYGPTYVVECTMCGKRFTRKSHDTKLNPHKTTDGYPCHGGYGIVVETKYN